ncbi:hypothetical protein [Pseudomonas putida]|uniref:Uncharacterized protein n=1 Tax=Pseudomonas putida TaxID=303 RepID=A0A1Q9QVU5_PSEPU|nr:hypothetical protein [Pseudomonas putida]OLS59227.1 hypothetical protein PSEMO_57360 [Pseudomonas putida]
MNAIENPWWMHVVGTEAMDSWFSIYDDHRLRRDYPSHYHDELLRRADEMDRQKLIDWRQWRDLRILADRSYLEAVAGAEFAAPATEAHGCRK